MDSEIELIEKREKLLSKELVAVRIKLQEATNKIAQLTNVISVSAQTTKQLEAIITSVRMQRDRQIEAEADSLVDYHLTKGARELDALQHKKEIKEIYSKLSPESEARVKLQKDLDEVRGKFADIKHECKKAENDSLEQANDRNELTNAFIWYINATAPLKYNLVVRFKELTGSELTTDVVIKTYKELDGKEIEGRLVDYFSEAYHDEYPETKEQPAKPSNKDNVDRKPRRTRTRATGV